MKYVLVFSRINDLLILQMSFHGSASLSVRDASRTYLAKPMTYSVIFRSIHTNNKTSVSTNPASE